jgi:alpha-glucosidase
MAVGEIEDEEPLKVQRDYTDGPDRLHTAYSFFLLRQRALTSAVIKDAMAQWQGARGWPSWSLSNHDVIRFPTRLADNDPQRTKLMMALLLALRGTAFLYQGDELGLPHADIPFERLRDPEAIAFWPSGIGRDGARTPMPWQRSANMAGFTAAPDAWLPLDPRHAVLAVDVQQDDPNSMLNFTRALVALRKASPALREGDIQLVDPHPMTPAYSFIRSAPGERVMFAFNLSDQLGSFAFPGTAKAILLKLGEGQADDDHVQLGPYSALFIAI